MTLRRSLRLTFPALALLAVLWASGGVVVADDAPAAAQMPAGTVQVLPPIYPMTTCPVSGDALGAMGDAVTIDYEGREVRFCCAHCEPAFRADPAKYLAKLDAAVVEAQKPHYPMTTCPVSGEALEGETVDHVYQGRLVRLCCPQCVDLFDADPAKYLTTLNAAAVEAQQGTYPTDKCVISGETLGEDGPIVDVLVGDRLVRLCCAQCVDTVKADPAAAVQALDAAAAADAAHE